jgi:hypothetical protein
MLERFAAAREAKGLDGSWMRKHLQVGVGFSDTEYALVRSSSQRLGKQVKALNEQASSISSGGAAPPERAKRLQGLRSQRAIAINAEISALRATLPPHKIAALEAFMVQFFSAKNAASPGSVTGATGSPKAVQK